MDILQDYAPTAFHYYTTASPYLAPVRRSISALQTRALPLVTPLLNKLLVIAQDSPSIVVVGIFLLFFLVMMQVLALVRRLMMWTLRLVWWTGVAAVLAVVVSAVAQRGPERVVGDLGRWAAHIGEVWWREYEGYKRRQEGGR